MKTFIQLSEDGKRAHWKFEAEEKPEFAPDIVLIDVTGLDPQPEEHWIWDGQKFSVPDPPLVDSVIKAKNEIAKLRQDAIDLTIAFINGDVSVKPQLEEIHNRIQVLKESSRR